jgi:release factor glutamine methyltransferase
MPLEDAMKRALWRLLLRARFVLWQHRRHDRLVLERGLGLPLLILPGVFNPTLFGTSGVVVDALRRGLVPPGSSVLDVGTGSGVLAIAAARTASRVVAVDANPAAIRCARVNALLNGVEDRVEVRHGNLFDPVGGERFDVVLCNPPFYLGEPRTLLEGAFYSTDFAARFSGELPSHLAANGFALVVLSSAGDEAGFEQAFLHAGLSSGVVAARKLAIETIRVYRLAAGRRS